MALFTEPDGNTITGINIRLDTIRSNNNNTSSNMVLDNSYPKRATIGTDSGLLTEKWSITFPSNIVAIKIIPSGSSGQLYIDTTTASVASPEIPPEGLIEQINRSVANDLAIIGSGGSDSADIYVYVPRST